MKGIWEVEDGVPLPHQPSLQVHPVVEPKPGQQMIYMMIRMVSTISTIVMKGVDLILTFA